MANCSPKQKWKTAEIKLIPNGVKRGRMERTSGLLDGKSYSIYREGPRSEHGRNYGGGKKMPMSSFAQNVVMTTQKTILQQKKVEYIPTHAL